MKIAVIGTGYVGLVTGACLAEIGHSVICLDIDLQKIKNLQQGLIPIYEPGLEDLVRKNIHQDRLFFSTQTENCLPLAEIIYIAVGTPAKTNGQADLQFVEAVAKDIGRAIKHYAIIINKSTVPIGTGDLVTKLIQENYSGPFDVVSNPEFLREGTAIDDSLRPDRIVLGCDNSNGLAIKTLKQLYAPFNCPIVTTNVKTAEMIKYASNSYLATSISFINSLARLSEKIGADVTKVSEGMKLDKRIGQYAFLQAGCGYGGSCFPKDVQALIKIGQQHGERLKILEEVELVNEHMKYQPFDKLLDEMKRLKNKTIAIWGLAFKPHTDDIRSAPALTLIEHLERNNATIKAFDRVAVTNTKKIYPQISYYDCPYETVTDADALIIMTEWPEFQEIDLARVRRLMRGNLVIDGRNIFSPKDMAQLGYIYKSIGR